MAWQDVKTDWFNGNGAMCSDVNRWEGNTEHIKTRQDVMKSPIQVRKDQDNSMVGSLKARAGLLSGEVPNIIILNRDPTSFDGEVGDICFVYKEV